MASGKSFIGSKLAQTLDYSFIDLDKHIEEKEQASIVNLFKHKGELYFRKKEHIYLNDLVEKDEKLVIATGGGTPCYYNNMDLIKNHDFSHSVYLRVSINTIVKRLKNETSKRPLVAHINTDEELTEFISKHLFERSQFYNEAQLVVDANNEPSKILEAIILNLF